MTVHIDLIEAQRRIAELEAALERIEGWAKAYPVAVFLAPTDAEKKACVDAMEAAVPNGSSKMHASWARHILDGIAGICRTALEAERP